jgi:hypothetical protein
VNLNQQIVEQDSLIFIYIYIYIYILTSQIPILMSKLWNRDSLIYIYMEKFILLPKVSEVFQFELKNLKIGNIPQ